MAIISCPVYYPSHKTPIKFQAGPDFSSLQIEQYISEPCAYALFESKDALIFIAGENHVATMERSPYLTSMTYAKLVKKFYDMAGELGLDFASMTESSPDSPDEYDGSGAPGFFSAEREHERLGIDRICVDPRDFVEYYVSNNIGIEKNDAAFVPTVLACTYGGDFFRKVQACQRSSSEIDPQDCPCSGPPIGRADPLDLTKMSLSRTSRVPSKR